MAPPCLVPASIDDTIALLRQRDYVAMRSLATALILALKMERPLFLDDEANLSEFGSPISRCVSRARTKSGDDLGRNIDQCIAAELSVVQAFIASPASASGVMNRTSHPSGSSENQTAVPALAALLPQKHLGTVLRPMVRADRWLPAGGSRPVWFAIRATHLLQLFQLGIRHGVQSDQVVTRPTRTLARRP